MRQVFLEKGAIVLNNVSQPILKDKDVLISVHYSCISTETEKITTANTKQSIFFSNIPQKVSKVFESVATPGIESTKALISEKLAGNIQALGYSCSGKIIAVGEKIKKFRPGDYVACAGAGLANHADLACVPENLVVHVPKKELLQAASITTIGAIALQGLRRAQVQLGETVCVLGLGLIGQITIQLAKCNGCHVIGVDHLEKRLTLAQKLGADAVYNAQDPQTLSNILFDTQQQGVDTTIVTAISSNNDIMQQAMEVTRKKGKIVIVGNVGLKLERSPFYQKEIDLLMSCSYGPGRYDPTYEMEGIDYPYPYVRWTENRNMQAFIQLLKEKKINIDRIIPKQLSIQEITKAYEQIQQKKELAVILSYLPKKEDIFQPATAYIQQQTKDYLMFKPAIKDQLRVGFIGAGGFAKVKLIPIVSRIKRTKINAIVDANITNSLNVSKLYGAARALTNSNELFIEDLIDVVIIASPHKYHCEQALTALQNNKAVFLEKPMVTDGEQLKRFATFLQKHPSLPFCVDYNRSFAPFIQHIKQALENRKSPLMISYRTNAGFIPKDHWIQTEVGAGRIIGEACHIFDLFYYLTDAEPISVSVESLKPPSDDLFPTDNFSVQLSFSDGSVCSLLYTSLGHNNVGKERMEIHFDSKTIIMNDYKLLEGYGLSSSFNMKTSIPDKGHEYLLKKFFTSLHQKTITPIIDLQRLIKVAQITLVVDKLACKGGGEEILP